MNRKAFILAMYFAALFIVIKHWYKQPGNSGMPYPTTITAPSYLYGILALTDDFTGGLSTVLAAGLTLGLFYRTQKGKDPIIIQTGPSGTTAKIQPKNVPYKVAAPTKPGTNP